MKWYLRNASRRLKYAVEHPGYALRTALRELTVADERFLAAITGTRAGQIREFLQEPSSHHRFASHLRGSEKEFRRGMSSADLWAKKILVQYAAVRALRPDTILETGVASGISTSYFLLALEMNQKGTLHSVEIGDASFLPAGREPGWIVPDWLRSRWRLHIGDATLVLPKLLAELGEIDVFVHDSLHSYEHMKREFELAGPFLRRGGLLIADDALWNPAFRDYAQAISSSRADILRGVGFVKC